MQKVEIYYDMLDAKHDMANHITKGWHVHTCTMGVYKVGYSSNEKILVVYEK